LKSAKALTEGAGKAAGRARRAMLLVGLVIAAVVYLWIRGKGRLSGSRPVLVAGGLGDVRWDGAPPRWWGFPQRGRTHYSVPAVNRHR
jgi:hypothetical protein